LLAAPDVAFTEAAVGAGFSTILMLGAISVLRQEEKLKPAFKLTPFLLMLAAGAIIFYGTLDLSPHGSKQAAAHLHVAPYYLERSIQDTSVPNVVTSVLASYRGFDTLGEVFVIFTAGIAVLALIGRAQRKRKAS
jgi:multicomponent Na+:H+ antiporter subunit B